MFFVSPAKYNGGRFPTKIGLSAYDIYFVNSTTVWWSITLIASAGCADKDLSVDALSTSFFLHNTLDLLYCDRISQSHIILDGLCHITNWYWNNLGRYLCATCGMLASNSNIFFIPLQSVINVNSAPHKYFLTFPIVHLTAATYTKNICLDFSSANTVDLEVKEIGRRCIPSSNLSNSHFLPSFYCASDFLA